MNKDKQTEQLNTMLLLFEAGYETTLKMNGTVEVQDPVKGYNEKNQFVTMGYQTQTIKNTREARKFLMVRG